MGLSKQQQLLPENEFYLGEGQKLTNIHPREACGDRPCVIHKPSDHHMRSWPLNWRPSSELGSIKPSHFERICPHGIGHPDPDDLAYHVEMGNDYMAVHGCDGCCAHRSEPGNGTVD